MSQKTVSFKTVDGYKISGVHTVSEGKSIVLWLHGITVHKDEYLNLFKDGADFLAKEGIDSLRIDFRGHGKSSGKPSSFTITGQMMDGDAAIKFILDKYKKKDIDIHIVGCSFGSPPSIYLGNKYADVVKSVTVIAPVLSYQRTFLKPETEWARELFNEKTIAKLKKTNKLYFNPKFAVSMQLVKEMELIDPEKMITESSSSITIIHGDEDSMVPFDVSKEISETHKNVALVAMRQMDHGFNDINDEDGDSERSIANKLKIFETILSNVK